MVTNFLWANVTILTSYQQLMFDKAMESNGCIRWRGMSKINGVKQACCIMNGMKKMFNERWCQGFSQEAQKGQEYGSQ